MLPHGARHSTVPADTRVRLSAGSQHQANPTSRGSVRRPARIADAQAFSCRAGAPEGRDRLSLTPSLDSSGGEAPARPTEGLTASGAAPTLAAGTRMTDLADRPPGTVPRRFIHQEAGTRLRRCVAANRRGRPEPDGAARRCRPAAHRIGAPSARAAPAPPLGSRPFPPWRPSPPLRVRVPPRWHTAAQESRCSENEARLRAWVLGSWRARSVCPCHTETWQWRVGARPSPWARRSEQTRYGRASVSQTGGALRRVPPSGPPVCRSSAQTSARSNPAT